MTFALTLVDYSPAMAETPVSERFLQIGEAAERASRTQRTLRYYEEKGLLNPPTRMDGGFRLYSREDMERMSAEAAGQFKAGIDAHFADHVDC